MALLGSEERPCYRESGQNQKNDKTKIMAIESRQRIETRRPRSKSSSRKKCCSTPHRLCWYGSANTLLRPWQIESTLAVLVTSALVFKGQSSCDGMSECIMTRHGHDDGRRTENLTKPKSSTARKPPFSVVRQPKGICCKCLGLVIIRW